MKYYTLGTSHGGTEKGCSCSANLVEINGDYYLFDCGGDVERIMTDMDLPIGKIRAAFISHLHGDHIVNLPAIAKCFVCGYSGMDTVLRIYFPEEIGLSAFNSWILCMGMSPESEKLITGVFGEGVVYSDGNVTVTAILTKHMMGTTRPSYAFMLETKDGKRVLYTGDLNCNFLDYPKVVFEKDFDLIVSELVHFNVEKNLDTIIASRTKKLVFTHMTPRNVPIIETVRERFPFDVYIAEDGNCYEA